MGRRRLLYAAGAVAAALVVFVLVWFQPQKLFIDDKVDEALPVVAGGEPDGNDTEDPDPGDPGSTTSTTEAAGPVDLATGEFISLDHGTSGTARVIELVDGSRFVRLEALATDNGPDLYVYLSTNPADGPEQAFDDDFVNLGRLKGNIGDQNYELSADVEIDRYRSVVIWCDRFNSAFGAADLS